MNLIIRYLNTQVNVLEAPTATPANSIIRISNPHKFNLRGITPQVQTAGGTVALGRKMPIPFPYLMNWHVTRYV
jgi:hypothetical protein